MISKEEYDNIEDGTIANVNGHIRLLRIVNDKWVQGLVIVDPISNKYVVPLRIHIIELIGHMSDACDKCIVNSTCNKEKHIHECYIKKFPIYSHMTPSKDDKQSMVDGWISYDF